MLNNTHVIVQQQPVLIQAQQHQELIMRQATAIHPYNNRVVYATSPQQQQQHVLQQHVQQQQVQQQQQQQMQLQATAQTAHLVQARVVPQQTQNVVYQQLQVQKVQQQQPQQQQQATQQQQQQQQPQLVATTAAGGTQLVRASFRGKSPRGAAVVARPGTLIATRPTLSPATIVRQVRPRAGVVSAVPGGIVRNMRPGGVRPARTQLVVQTSGAEGGQTMQIVTQTQMKHITISTNLGQQQQQQQTQPQQQQLQQQQRHIYRTHMVTDGNPQQQQQQHHMLMMRQGPIRYRAPVSLTSAVPTPVPAPAPAANPTGGVVQATNSNIGMDLEERIQAAVLKKEQQKPPPPPQPVAPNQLPPMQIGTGTTLTTYYPGGAATQEEDQQQQQQVVQSQVQGIRTAGGASMTLAEFKKRQTLSASPAPVSGPNPGLTPMRANTPGTLVRPAPKLTPTQQPQVGLPPGTRIMQPQRAIPAPVVAPVPAPAPAATTAASQGSSVQQTSHNNYEIHSQHVLNNRANQPIAERDKNSAKMLVILASGEQRLITFTLPRESCTVQDLLEQVGVPFDNATTIQCVEHRGANVDFVVTVGFSVNESASELISRAEESLQMNRSQDNPTPVSGGGAGNTSSNASPSYAQANAAAEQAKREAASSASGEIKRPQSEWHLREQQQQHPQLPQRVGNSSMASSQCANCAASRAWIMPAVSGASASSRSPRNESPTSPSPVLHPPQPPRRPATRP